MAELRDGVPLTELGVITRWSLAVRQSEAERADLIAELRADLAWLEKTSTRQTALRKPPVAHTSEVVADTPVTMAPTPLRRLPKPAPAAVTPAKAAPTKAAPTKSAPTKSAPTKAAPVGVTPRKAAPRGRRPAAGG